MKIKKIPRSERKTFPRRAMFLLSFFILLVVLFFSESHSSYSRAGATSYHAPQFTTTVDLERKIIHDAPIIASQDKKLSVWLWKIRSPVQEFLSTAPFLITASLGIADEYVVIRILPGSRKEEIASVLATSLGWTGETKKEFLAELSEDEGKISFGSYVFKKGELPAEILGAFESRFEEKVSSRYGPETDELVPVQTALTLASIVERESGGNEKDMSLIAGIFWNRIFSEDRLQSDVTLQYAKGNEKRGWWPPVYPRDKYIKSPFNTYLYEGLPPLPIASPSVAAIEAVLNPQKTACYFFLHDSHGDIHCSVTYDEHRKNISQYY